MTSRTRLMVHRASCHGSPKTVLPMSSVICDVSVVTGWVIAAGIEGAGLAVLTRDLLDGETFEFLFGPWRTVMHH